MYSKARILNGKIAFFLNFGGVLSEEIIEDYFPEEADLEGFKEIDLPKLKENVEKEKAPYSEAEYQAQVLGKAYDILAYHDVFTKEELEDIVKEFILLNSPTNFTSLYEEKK